MFVEGNYKRERKRKRGKGEGKKRKGRKKEKKKRIEGKEGEVNTTYMFCTLYLVRTLVSSANL
jgi:hypothetical protein